MSTQKQVTPHFTVWEFRSKDGVRVPPRGLPGLTKWCEWWGEPMRKVFGAVTILSGYRTPAHNAAVGGAPHSVHLMRSFVPQADPTLNLIAVAGDVRCERGTPDQWNLWAHEHIAANSHLGGRGRGGVGLYRGQGFVHLDTWSNRWWQG